MDEKSNLDTTQQRIKTYVDTLKSAQLTLNKDIPLKYLILLFLGQIHQDFGAFRTSKADDTKFTIKSASPIVAGYINKQLLRFCPDQEKYAYTLVYAPAKQQGDFKKLWLKALRIKEEQLTLQEVCIPNKKLYTQKNLNANKKFVNERAKFCAMCNYIVIEVCDVVLKAKIEALTHVALASWRTYTSK